MSTAAAAANSHSQTNEWHIPQTTLSTLHWNGSCVLLLFVPLYLHLTWLCAFRVHLFIACNVLRICFSSCSSFQPTAVCNIIKRVQRHLNWMGWWQKGIARAKRTLTTLTTSNLSFAMDVCSVRPSSSPSPSSSLASPSSSAKQRRCQQPSNRGMKACPCICRTIET